MAIALWGRLHGYLRFFYCEIPSWGGTPGQGYPPARTRVPPPPPELSTPRLGLRYPPNPQEGLGYRPLPPQPELSTPWLGLGYPPPPPGRTRVHAPHLNWVPPPPQSGPATVSRPLAFSRIRTFWFNYSLHFNREKLATNHRIVLVIVRSTDGSNIL